MLEWRTRVWYCNCESAVASWLRIRNQSRSIVRTELLCLLTYWHISEDLQRIFDDQIDRTCSLIDEQLRAMQLSHAGESVAYLVLSGGLGSSPYVQKRVREHYERGAGTGLANSQNMVVLVASEP